ncbi:hypothetical protein FB451DRAFT_1175785 [Mycena latifolia]|nr:hypothetical protein FB451DRAFT_1175785 [Mycena latifolia]
MIQEWLERVFLSSWDGTIEWVEWTTDPCPEKFWHKLFVHMMKLEQKPISEGEDEEGLRDSDSDCKILEDESLTSEGDSDIGMDAGNRSESPLTTSRGATSSKRAQQQTLTYWES